MPNIHLNSSFSNTGKHLHSIPEIYPGAELPGVALWNNRRRKSDLERVQKVACKVILRERYGDYPTALKILNLEPLTKTRDKLCLKFAKKCLMTRLKKCFLSTPQTT